MSRGQYIGRFAPSPTGDLHFGSLLAACGSYLQARFHGGLWLIRVEDLDPPREVPGSADRILQDLAGLGLESDAPVVYQSQRTRAYEQALEALVTRGDAFYCGCSRSQLQGHDVYPRTCREADLPPRGKNGRVRSARLRTAGVHLAFNDRLQGRTCQNFDQDEGDFVIRRGDGLTAYQLAVTVDDAWQRITEVVRGNDLLGSTARQILLFRRLGLPEPAYLHLPLIADSDGRKLSKRESDDPIRGLDGAPLIRMALTLLNHPPPAAVQTLDGLWSWAISHWNPGRLPSQTKIRLAS